MNTKKTEVIISLVIGIISIASGAILAIYFRKTLFIDIRHIAATVSLFTVYIGTGSYLLIDSIYEISHA